MRFGAQVDVISQMFIVVKVCVISQMLHGFASFRKGLSHFVKVCVIRKDRKKNMIYEKKNVLYYLRFCTNVFYNFYIRLF